MKKILIAIAFLLVCTAHAQSFYMTDAALTEIANRYDNGYITGTGFADDYARINTVISAFDVDNTANRFSNFHKLQETVPNQYDTSYTIAEIFAMEPDRAGEDMHIKGIISKAKNDVVGMDAVMAEIKWLTSQAEFDFTNTTRWNNGVRIGVNPFFITTSKFNKLIDTYFLIKSDVTNLSTLEESAITTFFQNYRNWLYPKVQTELINNWGASWQSGAYYGNGNLIGDGNSNNSYPIENSSGVNNPDFGVTWIQNGGNNRLAESLDFLHNYAIHYNDSSLESYCKDYFKTIMKICVFTNGIFWELYRNYETSTTDWELGISYSTVTAGALTRMAHRDAMKNTTDLLYDYETTDGILNGSSNHSVTYAGGSTTNGSTPKGLKLMLTAISKFYRNTANGGWNDVYYNDGKALDGGIKRRHSTTFAIANLFYKDQSLQDFYTYNQSVGYAAKGIDSDGYAEITDDGNWKNHIKGGFWLEQESNFFSAQNTTGKPTIYLTDEDIKAYPTAEGWGKNATGGRGLPVYFVTNLNNSGAGSLRQIEQDIENSGQGGNILFRTNGTINLGSGLYFSTGVNNITIYGQSATGNGITVHNHETNVRSSNFIMQHMKFRGGDGADAAHVQSFRIGGTNQNANRSQYAINQCSFTWGDNSGSFGVNLNAGDLLNTLEYFTLQNSIIGEGFNAKGGIAYGRGFSNASFINNAYINNSERNMRSSIGQDNSYEFINNYIYGHTYGLQATAKNVIDVIGNVYEDGWATQGSSATIELLDCSTSNCAPSGDTDYTGSQLYNLDNLFNNNAAPLNTEATNALVSSRINASTYVPLNSNLVKSHVLENAGARVNLEGLDAVDQHLVDDANNGTGSYANNESQTIGLPTFSTAPNYLDTDNDGLEDEWELLNGGLTLNHSDVLDVYDFDTFYVDQSTNTTGATTARYTALQAYQAHRAAQWNGYTKVYSQSTTTSKEVQRRIILSRRD
ncbi:hypothetical protein [Maribacter sp.]|uniref:hypothetical protein n=1 Tax=Maribacter sp. TaxID=1897614 RepID=UPI0025BE54DF|nr:hypothetical protein [Maribacter sp.]